MLARAYEWIVPLNILTVHLNHILILIRLYSIYITSQHRCLINTYFIIVYLY